MSKKEYPHPRDQLTIEQKQFNRILLGAARHARLLAKKRGAPFRQVGTYVCDERLSAMVKRYLSMGLNYTQAAQRAGADYTICVLGCWRQRVGKRKVTSNG